MLKIHLFQSQCQGKLGNDIGYIRDRQSDRVLLVAEAEIALQTSRSCIPDICPID
jgi:hypothetical protein